MWRNGCGFEDLTLWHFSQSAQGPGLAHRYINGSGTRFYSKISMCTCLSWRCQSHFVIWFIGIVIPALCSISSEVRTRSRIQIIARRTTPHRRAHQCRDQWKLSVVGKQCNAVQWQVLHWQGVAAWRPGGPREVPTLQSTGWFIWFVELKF